MADAPVTTTGPKGAAPLTLHALRDELERIERGVARLQQDRKRPQLRLDQLTNCAPMGTVADGQAPVYSRAAGQYVPQAVGGNLRASHLYASPFYCQGGPVYVANAGSVFVWLITGGGTATGGFFNTGGGGFAPFRGSVGPQLLQMPTIYVPNWNTTTQFIVYVELGCCSLDGTQQRLDSAYYPTVASGAIIHPQVSDFIGRGNLGTAVTLINTGYWCTAYDGVFAATINVLVIYDTAQFE